MADKRSSVSGPSDRTSGITTQQSNVTSGGISTAPTAQSVATTAATRSEGAPKKKDTGIGRKFKKRLAQYLAAIVVNMNVIQYGIALAWAGSNLPLLSSIETPLSTGPISETDKALLSACLPFMGLVATPVFSVLSSRISRKLMGYMIAICQLASWLMFLISDIHALLYVGRLLAGIAAGGGCVQVPTYVSEIAEVEIRGALGCILIFALNFGILIEFVLAAILSYQTQNIVYFLLPIIFIICNLFLPESPYFLLKKNKEDAAKKSFKKLRAGQGSKEWATLKEEFDSGADDKAKKPFKLIMSSRGMKRGLTIAVVSCVGQQLSGIFGILSYSAQIFTEAEAPMSPQTASIIMGLLQVFGTITSVLLVDRFGRRLLLIVSGMGIIISHGISAFYFTLKNTGRDVNHISLIPIICLSLYMVVFSLGFSPLPFVLITELLPHSVTSYAVAFSLTGLWTAATFVTLAFNPLSLVIGLHFWFIFFTICTMCATIFIFLCLPETKSRPLTEITTDLEEGSWIIFKKRSPEATPSGTVNTVA